MRSFLFILMSSFIFCTELQAEDAKHIFSIQEALNSQAFEGRLNKKIKFYFGTNKPNRKINRNLGEFAAQRRSNSFRHASDRKACEWVFLSALLSLQKRVAAKGGNAVINIRSFYKKNEMSSETKFECRIGLLRTGVALKGTVVSLD